MCVILNGTVQYNYCLCNLLYYYLLHVLRMLSPFLILVCNHMSSWNERNVGMVMKSIWYSGSIVHFSLVWQERPYHDDSTASRPLCEVKHHRARLVLRWGITLESRVLFFSSCQYLPQINPFTRAHALRSTNASRQVQAPFVTTDVARVFLSFF